MEGCSDEKTLCLEWISSFWKGFGKEDCLLVYERNIKMKTVNAHQ
jgi:hypothetical protein